MSIALSASTSTPPSTPPSPARAPPRSRSRSARLRSPDRPRGRVRLHAARDRGRCEGPRARSFAWAWPARPLRRPRAARLRGRRRGARGAAVGRPGGARTAVVQPRPAGGARAGGRGGSTAFDLALAEAGAPRAAGQGQEGQERREHERLSLGRRPAVRAHGGRQADGASIPRRSTSPRRERSWRRGGVPPSRPTCTAAARKTSYNFGVRYGRRTQLDLYAIDDDGRARSLGAVPLRRR